MPYSMSWEEKGVVWEFSGEVTAQEIEEANTAFYNDERSDLAKYQIIDAREVDCVEWEEREIKKTAALDVGASKMIRNVRVAYVAHSPEIADRLEKYAEITRRLNSSWQVEGFSTMEEAGAWVTS